MADALVWIRCKGCRSVIRLLAFSGGEWGLWNAGVENFISEHMTEACHGNRLYNSQIHYNFFEFMNEGSLERLLREQPKSSGNKK